LLKENNRSTAVLVVGAGELGLGIGELISEEAVKVVQTDVQLGSNIAIIADGHDLPFLNESFDAVVAQAVLEHVLDPYRCVAELHRVLKPGGFVYAETPFMYPVHMGPYDFTRFSMSGDRRLFRYFSQIDSNMASGPGTALAVSIRSFALSFSNSPVFLRCVKTFLPFLIFWLKYFDYFLIRKPHAADFASSFYFLGKKTDAPIGETEIVEFHWSRRRQGS
jgi:SAM-dependent methyltransferase